MNLLVFLLLPCLSLSEVVKDFGECKKMFFLGDVPPQFTIPSRTALPPWAYSLKRICQCLLDDKKQPKYFYATLYSTALRIPVYSAYKFEKRSEKFDRVDYWYIEPQLDAKAGECMATEANIQNIGNNQAVKSDYEGQDHNGPTYDRGHLYPVQHTYTTLSMKASSTLTNVAPQDACFNRLQWYYHEKNVIADLKSCTEAYVVTGVVPDLNKPKLKGRVTVSKYYWRATCCQKRGVYIGKGYFGPDNNDKVQTLSITELQTRLAKDYGVNNIVIFPGIPGGCN